MDSLTQLALGAAVGEAVLGRRGGHKAALWGGVVATLPDLDVFIPLGDAVKDFTYHRSASHSLFILALLTPLVVGLILKVHPTTRVHKVRWVSLVYLVFATHVLLDSFTAYGTQIFWPLITTPVSWSTVFIIDPLYTLPLIAGVISALVMTRDSDRGHRLNRLGLIVSSLYLGWTVVAKVWVDRRFGDDLRSQNISDEKVFTTPAPFNSLLWRAVVMDEAGYYEAYFSVFDGDGPIQFKHYASDTKLLGGIDNDWAVQRLQWFSRGFYAVSLRDSAVVISDLRMGIEPDYVFQFKVGTLSNSRVESAMPQLLPVNRDLSGLSAVWRRIWNQSVELGGR